MAEIAKIRKPRLSDVLTELLKYKNLTASELARRILIPQPTIQRLVSGLHSRPHKKTLESLARYFEVTNDQIVGIEPIDWLTEDKNYIRRVPLLTSKQIIQWPACPKVKLNYVTLDIEAGKRSFATRMTDSSMEPVIPKNSILIVDPDKAKGYRSFVIIQRKNFEEVIVRQMIKDANTCYVRAVGADFNNIHMSLLDKKDKVYGVVIEVRMQLEN